MKLSHVATLIIIAIFVLIVIGALIVQQNIQNLLDMGCDIEAFNQYGMPTAYRCPGDPGYRGE